MELLDSEKRVVDAAIALASTLGTDLNHTVAAAAMDAHGGIHTAVNVHHFTGGPCAELVVLGVAAAAGAGPLVTIAAAGCDDRGVLAPCGRCRQVIVDLHPDAVAIVPTADGLDAVPIQKLLPGAYRHPDASPQRVLRFNRRYFDEIAAGRKVVTVRYDEDVPRGEALFVFEDDPLNRTLRGEVLDVQRYRLDQLTPNQAKLTTDAELNELRVGMLAHYPAIGADADIDVVSFRLAD